MKMRVEPVINDVQKGIKEYRQTLKEFLISASIMIVAWVILGILNYIGIENKFLFPLNFLTASLNGMQGGGVIGIIGGIIAKLTLLTMVVQTLIPIIRESFAKDRKKKFEEKNKRLKEMTKNVFREGVKLTGFILLGIGCALIIYAFLTVNGNFENSFVIVLALLTTLRILLSQTGAVIRFFTTLFRLTPVNNMPVYSVFIGLSIGFTLSVSFAVIFASAPLAYIAGCIVIVTGYVLIMKEKKRLEKVKIKKFLCKLLQCY